MILGSSAVSGVRRENGQVLQEPLRKSRVSEDDILERARLQLGVERLDQIKYVVMERGGEISIIPWYVSWANPDASSKVPPLPRLS